MPAPIIRRLYTTPRTFKRVVGIEDTWSDEMLTEALAAATSKIETHCSRFFYELTATMFFTPTCADRLLLRDADLVALTEVAGDDGSGAYGTVWTGSQYALLPANAAYASPPRPYWELVALPGRSLPIGRNWLRLTGRWGFPLEWRAVSATVRNTAGDEDPPAGITASTTTLPVSVDDEIEPGHTVKIGSEQLYVTRALSVDAGADLTVERGVNGTTAASHDAASAIAFAKYPDLVEIACRLQANRYLHRPNAAFGVVGTVNVGDIRLSARLDPDVQEALVDLVRG